MAALLSVLLAAVMLLSACGRHMPPYSESDAPDDSRYPQALGAFSVDNRMPLEELLTQTYDLAELQAYFPARDRAEAYAFSDYELGPEIRIEAVDQVFPVECLRLHFGCYYTVYRVREGGYYYVIWYGVRDDADPLSESFESGIAFHTKYLTKPRKESDFLLALPGLSTAEDVGIIDPAMELSLFLSSGDYSISLLENGKIMVIGYRQKKPDVALNNRGDLIVEWKEVVDLMTSGGHLAAIFPDDLPW